MKFHHMNKETGALEPKLTASEASELTTASYRMIADDLGQDLVTISNAKRVIYSLCESLEEIFDIVSTTLDEDDSEGEEDEGN